MASSNIADLSGTASPALQNWDAEWAAAENGKSYWDDYLAQITAEYTKEEVDIELGLQEQKAKYDEALAGINLDLEDPQRKYDLAIEKINTDLQSNLNNLQENYRGEANYNNAISEAQNFYNSSLQEIIDEHERESRIIESNHEEHYRQLELSYLRLINDPLNFMFQSQINAHREEMNNATDILERALKATDELAVEKRSKALDAFNEAKAQAEGDKTIAEMNLASEEKRYQSTADDDKAGAEVIYYRDVEAVTAQTNYEQAIAAAEQQKSEALDDHEKELAEAVSARDTARSEFILDQEAAAAEEAAKQAAEKAAASESDGGASDQANATTTVLNTDISLEQRHTDFSGGDFLKLGYALKGNDDTGNPGGDASDLGVDSSGLTNVAVLGPNTSDNKTYTLEISAESLNNAWDLESADIVLKYDTQLFDKIDTGDITLGNNLTLEKGIVVDDDNGLIRIAASSLSNNIFNEGDSIGSEAIFASIKVNFDETYFEDSERTIDANGKFTFEGNPLGFELSANSDSTVFSRTFTSDADGKEIGGRKSFLVENSEFTGSDIEVISSTKYWAGMHDILHFNSNLDNPNGVKSVVISEQIDNEWVDIVSKTAEEIYGENNTLPGSISWAYNSLQDSIGRSSIFGENELRIQSIYEDAEGITHATNSYFDKSANPDWAVNQTYGVDGSDSFVFDIDTYTNREIQSLGDLKGDTAFDPGDVNLYQAEIKFEEQTGGLTFGTDRVIGADQGFTNLIRRGDTVTAETTIENIGNSLAKDIVIDDAGQVENANFIASRFLKKFSVDDEQSITAEEKVNLSGGVFRDDFSYNADGQESLNIEVDMKVTGQAGSVVDVTKGLFKVSAEGMTQNPETEATPDFFVSSAGSKNLITFQGDLNYDGRVSMKDLAFLNAGAARQQLVDSTVDDGNLIQVASDDSYARDVDADFSGKIDLADLSILDQDWGQSLHDGTSGGFTGSSDTFTMGHLDAQGDETWDNDSFKNQNAIEAEDAYIGSLETTVAAGDIGANSGNNTDPMTGEELLNEG